MEYYELDAFATDLAVVRDYLAELAFLSESYQISSSTRWITELENTEQVIGIIQDLPLKISSVQRLAVTCGRDFSTNLKVFLDKSDFQRRLSRIATKVRIANTRSKRPVSPLILFRVIASVFSLSQKRLFHEDDINIEELISDTDLFRGNVLTLRELLFQKQMIDDEIFHPSNIDIDEFSRLLEEAGDSLRIDSAIPEKTRKQLLDYLEQAKTEISKSSPSWKKIVGALVIASAITSGFADAPQAAENIRKAYDYIMGHSIPTTEQHLPSSLPFRSSFPVLLTANSATIPKHESPDGEIKC